LAFETQMQHVIDNIIHNTQNMIYINSQIIKINVTHNMINLNSNPHTPVDSSVF